MGTAGGTTKSLLQRWVLGPRDGLLLQQQYVLLCPGHLLKLPVVYLAWPAYLLQSRSHQ
jgi:hypothetical protein